MLLLLACSAPPPPPYAPDLSGYAGAERACLESHCVASASAEAFGACRAETCAERKEAWAVEPTLLRYDDGVVTMSVQVKRTPGGFGDVDVPHTGDTWLGATVLTSTGQDIDLAVQTVFADRLSEPFTFSSEVGKDVAVAIVGLWGKKIEPCDSTRSGCQMFGFVLDDSLAAWPPDTYSAAPHRQRFLPPSLTVALSGALVPDRRAAVVDTLGKVFATDEQRFGTKFAVGSWVDATGPDRVVLHRDVNDGPLAARVAGALGPDVAVRHDPAATADLAVVLGCPGNGCP